ncbi:hypothetical protein H0X90_31220 [Burkholderia sp. 9775_39]|uniref:hypothetical protein n=1 Tax=unclassified Burkholderia TaxID=2613784 RepID=UPI0018C44DF2|nr:MULTISPECIES: hypothetical protein [unclassified Burkholderia]MBG0881280.1 hypothetical protein [Burkholderia sp. 9775_39]MBG0887643.1 hypothetical protein [Burkholderia sp. 9773_38]
MKRLFLVVLLTLCSTHTFAIQPQYLQPTSTSFAQRGGTGVIEFTATRTVSSIVSSVTLDAPDGIVFTAVQGSNLPTCKITNSFPTSRITCEGSSVSGNAFFPFSPINKLQVSYAVDIAANVGALSGVATLNSRYAGSTTSPFTVNVMSAPDYTDQNISNGRPKRDLSTYLEMIDNALNPIQPKIVAVRGKPSPDESVNPYGAVGELSMRNSNNKNDIGYCSASVVPSKEGNLVMTAAHCFFPRMT